MTCQLNQPRDERREGREQERGESEAAAKRARGQKRARRTLWPKWLSYIGKSRKDSQAYFPGLEKLRVGGKVLAVPGRQTAVRQRAASPFDMLIVPQLAICPGIET